MTTAKFTHNKVGTRYSCDIEFYGNNSNKYDELWWSEEHKKEEFLFVQAEKFLDDNGFQLKSVSQGKYVDIYIWEMSV